METGGEGLPCRPPRPARGKQFRLQTSSSLATSQQQGGRRAASRQGACRKCCRGQGSSKRQDMGEGEEEEGCMRRRERDIDNE